MVVCAKGNIIVATREFEENSGVYGPKVDEVIENYEVHRDELLAFGIDESHKSHDGRAQKFEALGFGQFLQGAGPTALRSSRHVSSASRHIVVPRTSLKLSGV